MQVSFLSLLSLLPEGKAKSVENEDVFFFFPFSLPQRFVRLDKSVIVVITYFGFPALYSMYSPHTK